MFLAYSEHVRYAEQLARIRRSFPEDQIHVVLHDDLAEDPEGTLAATFRFLGVEPDHPVVAEHRNRVIAGRAGDALHVRLASRLLYALPEETLHALNRQAKRARHRPPPPLDPTLAGRLRARFQPEVVALGEALGVDLLTRWAYRSEA